MATAVLQAVPVSSDADRYKYKYFIAIAVTLAATLELVDTSIVNVAIPHMMGNLGATLDEISWVSTGYIIANVIVIPMSGWLSASRSAMVKLSWATAMRMGADPQALSRPSSASRWISGPWCHGHPAGSWRYA